MTATRPPALATWLLKHAARGNDALVGDLFEEHRRRRSDAWYWRQVLTVVVLNLSREAVLVLGRRGPVSHWQSVLRPGRPRRHTDAPLGQGRGQAVRSAQPSHGRSAFPGSHCLCARHHALRQCLAHRAGVCSHLAVSEPQREKTTGCTCRRRHVVRGDSSVRGSGHRGCAVSGTLVRNQRRLENRRQPRMDVQDHDAPHNHGRYDKPHAHQRSDLQASDRQRHVPCVYRWNGRGVVSRVGDRWIRLPR